MRFCPVAPLFDHWRPLITLVSIGGPPRLTIHNCGAALELEWPMLSSGWVLLLVTAGLAIAQDTLSKSFILVKPLAGCYDLRVPSWKADEARRNDFLPMRFQLTVQLDLSSKGQAFVARSLDSRVHYGMKTSWNANSDGTVALGWGTWYAGYIIRLTGAPTELHGTAQFWTDTDPYPLHTPTDRNTMKVVAHRVECKDSTN
jgi:hypothetical protein